MTLLEAIVLTVWIAVICIGALYCSVFVRFMSLTHWGDDV